MLFAFYDHKSLPYRTPEGIGCAQGIQEGVPAAREYKGGFAAKHMTKDLLLAIEASEANGVVPVPMARQALQLYQQASRSIQWRCAPVSP